MSEILDFSTTAANNDSAAPDGFKEDMAYSDVNDSARELMAAIARDVRDGRGWLSYSGTAEYYTLNASRSISSYDEGQVFGFQCHAGNSGSATTINIDSIGQSDVVMPDGSDPNFVTDGIYIIARDDTNSRFIVISATNEGPQVYAERAAASSRDFDPNDFSRTVRVTTNSITLSIPSGLGSGGEQIRLFKVIGFGTFTLQNDSGGTVYFPNGSDIADGGSTDLEDGTYTLTKIAASDWLLTDC